jgi:hypothetical protein
VADAAHNITGGCICGAVAYEASETPMRVGYCHCRMCQGLVAVHIDSLDRPEAFAPNSHTGTESQVPWLHIHDDLARRRTDMPGTAKAAGDRGRAVPDGVVPDGAVPDWAVPDGAAPEGTALEGACLCGDIRYRVTAPPSEVVYCHCRMCQK